MSYEQLRDQLERAGRRSVPAPREEFVDALLARIHMGDADLPRPVPLAARSASRRLRLTAVVGMAAALLIVVGAVATLQSAPSGENDVAAQLAGQTLPGGSSVEGDFLAGNPEDGTHPAVCTRGGRIATADGAYICQKGERLEVEVADGKIVSVRPEDGSTTSVSAETSALPRFELKPEQDGDEVKVRWARSTEPNAGRYVVLRTSSDTAGTKPVEPAYPADQISELDLDKTAFSEVFDEVVPSGTPAVAYRVAVVDDEGNLLAMSGTVTVELTWSAGR